MPLVRPFDSHFCAASTLPTQPFPASHELQILPSPPASTGTISICHHPLFIYYWGLNSGPYANEASTLLTVSGMACLVRREQAIIKKPNKAIVMVTVGKDLCFILGFLAQRDPHKLATKDTLDVEYSGWMHQMHRESNGGFCFP